MGKEHYWMWVTRIHGVGRKTVNRLIQALGSPEEIWRASAATLRTLPFITEEQVGAIIKSREPQQMQEWIYEMQEKYIRFYSIEHSKFPTDLKNIADPPLGLYVRGTLPEDTNHKIAIIGSRNSSEYGNRMAYTLGRNLAQQGIVIVSGMARGIDTISHKGALSVEGSTIAVLGNGVDICYPKENMDIMNQIIQSGAVISEWPPGTQPHPGFFPLRNRIISGLSKGVVVVEAARKSGTLITVEQALEQGRDVFAVPGNATSKLSEGTNDLIKQGAKLVTDVNDIIEELSVVTYDQKISQKNTVSQNVLNSLAQDENLVYDCISLEPIFIDQLSINTNYPIQTIQYILTMLELKGFIQQLSGKRFIRTI